jgi:hypothetical protein
MLQVSPLWAAANGSHLEVLRLLLTHPKVNARHWP